jgi:ABC-type lipoprotein export system ATPase subunit
VNDGQVFARLLCSLGAATSTNIADDRGAEWGKWDLHVHTPCSLRQQYGGNSEDVWERYLKELEALPPEFTVLGINDYWFLDGYRKVVAARRSGRLSNIKAVFPVLELRLEQFGGTDGHLSRANLHVIFDPALDADVIQEQFISALTSKFALMPSESGKEWKGVVTRQALKDLGVAIKASVPPDIVHTLGSDTKAGFDNLVVSLDAVQQALSSSYFQNRAILALGKTEWTCIKWQQGAVASKKHLVNTAKLLFTAFDDPSRWHEQREKLEEAKVNSHLLDCSDAHTWSTGSEKDRIGNCATWIRAAPTFGGLLHALSEFDSRVYVGVEPPDLIRLRTSPEKIIESIIVRPRANKAGKLFDYELALNPGLVAVIGNKGQGKSALLDCIARAGNSSRTDDFAFLNPKRFLHPRTGQGDGYEVEVRWRSERNRVAGLADSYQPASLEAVEYLPQALVERICNSDPTSEHRDAFENELKRVIFCHIPRAEREGQLDLDGLLALRTKSVTVAVKTLRDEIYAEAERLVELEKRSRELVPTDIRSRLEALYESRKVVQSDLALATADLQLASNSTDSLNPTLIVDRERMEELDERLAKAQELDQADTQSMADANRRASELDSLSTEIEGVRTQVLTLNTRVSEILSSDNSFVELHVDTSGIEVGRRTLTDEVIRRQTAIEERKIAIVGIRAERDGIADRLAVADVERENYRRKVEQLGKRLGQLNGQEDDSETIFGLEHLLRAAQQIPADMQASRFKLLSACRRMYELLYAQIQAIRQLYEPAANFISEEPLASEAAIQFEAELVVSGHWESLTNALDGRRTSELLDFLGAQREAIKTDSAEDVVEFVESTLSRLRRERGGLKENARPLKAAFRSNIEAAQWISDLVSLKWLDCRFGLTDNGMPLIRLSPGQRGLILLLFYLLVDRSDSPLLIDQPEENLDNDAVRRLLVPALKKARTRRQIIIVTHNANLAVVGDADQILACTQEDNAFVIRSGSLAGHETGEITINVLEGSRGAFQNRRDKYEAVVRMDLSS